MIEVKRGHACTGCRRCDDFMPGFYDHTRIYGVLLISEHCEYEKLDLLAGAVQACEVQAILIE